MIICNCHEKWGKHVIITGVSHNEIDALKYK